MYGNVSKLYADGVLPLGMWLDDGGFRGREKYLAICPARVFLRKSCPYLIKLSLKIDRNK